MKRPKRNEKEAGVGPFLEETEPLFANFINALKTYLIEVIFKSVV